ncbi:uncharacterized protein EV420DRAFT_1506052, partial [Desarmillaria tabescens]
MVQSCAICLSQCNSPVSTPCGHIFCQICISEHILQSNGFQSFCPTCRENFPIGAPELQHPPRSFHQFVLPSIRRVFLDTSPDPEVEVLKRRLKMAEDRLEQQSRSHALTISRLTRQLEFEAMKKRHEKERAALLEKIYGKEKYESLRDDFYCKPSSSSLSSVTNGVKRQRSDSSGDLEEDRKPSPSSFSLPVLTRSVASTSKPRISVTMYPPHHSAKPLTLEHLDKLIREARQALKSLSQPSTHFYRIEC